MSINIFNIIAGTNTENKLIPARPTNAPIGSEFCRANMDLVGAKREANILNEFLSGNIPDFLRSFSQIVVSDGTNTITYLCTSDFLSIGTDLDYVRMPMNPLTAQKIADKYDCSLPTRKMVNDIYSQARNKLAAKPWGPPYNEDMERTHRILTHNETINKQLANLKMNPFDLTEGHKKNTVITNKLAPNNPKKRVAIYGFFTSAGKAIQDLNAGSHSDVYQDYADCVRLIANDVIVNGNIMRLQDVFSDPILSSLVSDEGILKFLRY